MRVGLLDGVVGNFVYYRSAWRTRNQCFERVAAVVQWALLLTSRTWLSTTTSSGPSAECYTVDDKVLSDPGGLDVITGCVCWATCSRRGDGVLRGRAVARVDRECLHCGSSLPQNRRVKVWVSASMLATTQTQFISTTEQLKVTITNSTNDRVYK